MAAAAGARDFWTVNGSLDFGYIPGGLIPIATTRTPVRLQRGDRIGLWGHDHILADHYRWVVEKGMTIPHLLLTKLSQPGTVWTTDVSSKFKIGIQLSPGALLILKYWGGADAFFGVTSLYFKNSAVDGTFVGKFRGCDYAQRMLKSNPSFALLDSLQTQSAATVTVPSFTDLTASAPKVTVRKRRSFSLPSNDEGPKTGT